MNTAKAGEWAFLISVIIAVLAGLASPWVSVTTTSSWAWVSVLLVILGIIVGLLNITEKETTAFLVASIALIVAGIAAFLILNNVIWPIGTIISSIVGYLAIFVAPAAVIVAVKAIAALASKK
jgi:inner membrane protein involved in colicin E2 resistance